MELDKSRIFTEEQMLFEFRSPQQVKRWEAVNDDVMGGASSGHLKWDHNGYATFQGVITLTNESGFASVRSLINPLQVKDGMVLRVRGHKTFKFKLRTDPFLDGVSFMQPFQVIGEEWQDVRLPFAKFQPTFRGLVIPDAPPLEPAKIRQVGILISNQQEGEFKLDLDWIKAY